MGGTLWLGGVTPATRYALRALEPQTGRWTDQPPMAADARGHLRVSVPAFWQDVLLCLEPA